MIDPQRSDRPSASPDATPVAAGDAPVAPGPLVPIEVRTKPTRGATAPRRSVLQAHRGWFVLLAVVLAGLAWGVGRPYLLGPLVTATPVVRADLVQSLVASGRVATPFRVSIGSQITGVVTRVPVREGQTVTEGDTLLVLDATEARALTQQAEGQVAQAEARMRQLRDVVVPSAVQALAEANATARSMQQIFDRNLADAGYDTPASRDAAKANLDVARARARAAELQVATNRPGGSDYRLAESQLQQARANLAAVRSRSGYRVVTAPRTGVLIARSVEVGDVVQPGRELMQLSPQGDVEIVVRIDERNLGLLAIGQPALVSADAYPAETFSANVVFINPAIDPLRASVEVKLRVPDPPATLRQDMTVSVDIEAAERPRALIAPSADIHDLGTPAPWVLVARGGHARRVPVSVGLVSAGRAEMLSGVAEGDLVLPARLTSVEDGRRIRVRTDGVSSP